MPKSVPSKQQLRRDLRARRRALSADQALAAAQALPALLRTLPAWPDLQHVAGYLAADAELDPALLLDDLHRAGKQVYLPVIQADSSLLFAPWAPGEALQENRYGIGEPARRDTLRSAAELDALLLPLVGWTREGRRLGMGGGFYDRSLACAGTALKIGLGYSVQEVSLLPADPWDVGLDYIATAEALLDCRA